MDKENLKTKEKKKMKRPIILLALVFGFGITAATAKLLTVKSPQEVKDEKVIDNFEKPGIWSWWGSKAIKVEQDGSALKINVTGAGDPAIDNGYSTFGRDHSMETLDFSETPIVKLRVKADKDVTIRLNVKDIDDYVNNKENIVKTIKGGTGYQDIYFDFSDKWEQNYPNDAEVDNEEIKEFLIFINPGGSKAFTGTVHIDQLSLLSEMP